jgi:hypothetical protein
MTNAGFEAGIVYAAGWLAAAHGEDGLAEELLETADLITAAKCRKAGADDYDIKNCRPAFSSIAQRRRNVAARTAPASGREGGDG